MKEYKIVYCGGEGEIVEKKSRFIATVKPVDSEEEASAFIAEMKKKYWDARHNCSAFVIGEHNEIQRSRQGQQVIRWWTCCSERASTTQPLW